MVTTFFIGFPTSFLTSINRHLRGEPSLLKMVGDISKGSPKNKVTFLFCMIPESWIEQSGQLHADA